MAPSAARIRLLRTLALLLLGSLIPASAGATVISGSSSAFDGTFDATVSGLGVLSAGPAAQVSGAAPAPYTLTDSVANFVFSDVVPVSGGDVLIDLDITLLSADASSNVDGGPGSRTTDASGGISTAALSIVFDPTGVAPPVDLVILSVSVLSADASVSGDFGSLSATGSSSIVGGNAYVYGEGSWTFSVNPAANTVIVSVPGLSLVLNEQIEDCSGPVGGTDSCSILVNAAHLEVNKTIGGHLVNASAIVAHAQAAQVAVPEPSTAVLLAFGLTLLARGRRSSLV